MKWEHARLLKFSFAIQEWPAIKTNGSRNRKQNKKKNLRRTKASMQGPEGIYLNVTGLFPVTFVYYTGIVLA